MLYISRFIKWEHVCWYSGGWFLHILAMDFKEKRPLQQYFESNIPNAMCIPNMTICYA